MNLCRDCLWNSGPGNRDGVCIAVFFCCIESPAGSPAAIGVIGESVCCAVCVNSGIVNVPIAAKNGLDQVTPGVLWFDIDRVPCDIYLVPTSDRLDVLGLFNKGRVGQYRGISIDRENIPDDFNYDL